MAQFSFGDHVTLEGRVVSSYFDAVNSRQTIRIRFNAPDGALQGPIEICCCETALQPVSVVPITDEDIAMLDASDRHTQESEIAAAKEANRSPLLVIPWRQRMNVNQ